MQHLCYQPLLPCVNKHLQRKWDQTSYDLHLKKIKTVKSAIDMLPPEKYPHLFPKLMEHKNNEWMRKIQRENKMLMDKILFIMRTTGSVDNTNYYERKSLSLGKQQKERLQIMKENQAILARLSQCRPHYSVSGFSEDWARTRKLMDTITRYPRGRVNQQCVGSSSGC